jgi:hypothetical protein
MIEPALTQHRLNLHGFFADRTSGLVPLFYSPPHIDEVRRKFAGAPQDASG